MINEYYKLLNSTEVLRQNLKIFIDAFVEYYGEENRHEIEEKFSKALFITYKSPDDIKLLLFNLKKYMSDKLKKEILNGIDTLFTDDLLFGDNNFENNELMPIFSLRNFFNSYKLGKEGRKEKFINEGVSKIREYLPDFTKEDLLYIINNKKYPERYQILASWIKNNIEYYSNLDNIEKEYKYLFNTIKIILKKIDSNITLDNLDNYLDSKEINNLQEIINRFREKENEYDDFLVSLNDYIKYEQERVSIYDDLNTKYYKEYIKENLDLIPINKRGNIENYLNDQNNRNHFNNFVNKLLGYSVKGKSLLEYFSDESDEILKNSKASWEIDIIINKRIEFFTLMGIPKMNSYEEYIDNENVRKIWPTKEKIQRFIKTKYDIINKYNIEYYSLYPEYKMMRKEIEGLQLLDKNDLFDIRIYEKKGNFVAPNLRKTDYGYELFGLVGIYCGSQNRYIDANIVHELNHLFETVLLEVNKDEYKVSCGWELLIEKIESEKDDIDTINLDRELRPYELFNEAINELISQEISQILHKNNKHIFNSKKTALIKRATSYEDAFFIVEDFFKDYKKVIIDSRRNGNIELIWNEVGKENFDELNSLFKIFIENFSGMRYYYMKKDFNNNIDNEKTRLYKSLIIRKDEIFEKMKNYKNLNNSEVKKK